MKKRILAIFLICLLAFTACGQKADEIEDVEGQAAYQYLLLPEGIEFGMTKAQVKEIVGEDVTDVYGEIMVDPFRYQKKNVLFEPDCSLGSIKYEFKNESPDQAESEWPLVNVKIEVYGNPYINQSKKRTDAELAQNVAAAYENIVDFFTEQYGAPAHEFSLSSGIKNEYWNKSSDWDLKEQGIGISFYLFRDDNFSIRYFPTADLYDDWYDR